jgi:hypothetical protein
MSVITFESRKDCYYIYRNSMFALLNGWEAMGGFPDASSPEERLMMSGTIRDAEEFGSTPGDSHAS